MRRSTTLSGAVAVCLAAAALPVGWSSAAHAGALVSASLTIEPGWGSLTFPGVGATGTATSATSATLGAGSAFNGTETFTTPLPSLTPVDVVKGFLGANGAGSFAGATAGSIGGSASFSLKAQMYATAPATAPFLSVPVKVGKTTVFAGMTPFWGVKFTVFGNPWTAGVASTSITSLTTGGMTGMALVTAQGMNALSPGGGGTLTLVSVGKVIVDVPFIRPVVSALTLTYVPEPGTLALLGVGAAGLSLLGRRRPRR